MQGATDITDYARLPEEVSQALLDIESDCGKKLDKKNVLLYVLSRAVNSRITMVSLISAINKYFGGNLNEWSLNIGMLKALSVLRTLLSRDDSEDNSYALRNVLLGTGRVSALRGFIKQNRQIPSKLIRRGVLCPRVTALLQASENHATNLYDEFVSFRDELNIKDDSFSLRSSDRKLSVIWNSDNGSTLSEILKGEKPPTNVSGWMDLFNKHFPNEAIRAVASNKIVVKVSKQTCNAFKKVSPPGKVELLARIEATKKEYLRSFGSRSTHTKQPCGSRSIIGVSSKSGDDSDEDEELTLTQLGQRSVKKKAYY